MDFLAAVTPLSVLSGFIVGLLVGLTGVGGGSLMTPLLILVFGTEATTAVGTDLLYAAATKSVGTVAHGLGRTVDWPIVARLAAGSMPGTVLTIAALHLSGIRENSSPRLITITLGVALLLSAAAVLGRQWIRRRLTHRRRVAVTPRTVLLTVAAGFILGVLVTISSVGAAALGMTALVCLYPSVPLARLVGSDIAHAVPLTLAAGLGHWLLGSVDWALMIALLLGSVPGIILGSNLSSRLPERVLRPILAAILMIVGLRMLRG
jgi:uncharacterized membrane protein YfcA